MTETIRIEDFKVIVLIEEIGVHPLLKINDGVQIQLENLFNVSVCKLNLIVWLES